MLDAAEARPERSRRCGCFGEGKVSKTRRTTAVGCLMIGLGSDRSPASITTVRGKVRARTRCLYTMPGFVQRGKANPCDLPKIPYGYEDMDAKGTEKLV